MLILKKSKSKIIKNKPLSKAMCKYWTDPEKREKLCIKFKEKALKRKYSKAGYSALQRHAREVWYAAIKDRDNSYMQSEEYREKCRQGALKRYAKKKRKRIEKRINTYCGVLTEQEMASL
jgi:hypothetical protein